MFVSVPGPLQTVQRAELWGVILALQSSDAVHVGVHNLGVVRHVGRLENGHRVSTPFELVTDGDLLVLIDRMPGIGDSEWVTVPASAICADDIAHWPYTPGLLIKWVVFFRNLAFSCWWSGSLVWWHCLW